MANISRRLAELERDRFEEELERRLEEVVEAMIDVLEQALDPAVFRAALDALAKLDREERAR